MGRWGFDRWLAMLSLIVSAILAVFLFIIEDARSDAQSRASEAQRRQLAAESAQRDAEDAQRDAEDAQRDAEDALRDAEDAQRDLTLFKIGLARNATELDCEGLRGNPAQQLVREAETAILLSDDVARAGELIDQAFRAIPVECRQGLEFAFEIIEMMPTATTTSTTLPTPPPTLGPADPAVVETWTVGSAPTVVTVAGRYVLVAANPDALVCIDPVTSGTRRISIEDGDVVSVAADPRGDAWAGVLRNRSLALVRLNADCTMVEESFAPVPVGRIDQVNIAAGEGSVWVIAGRSGSAGTLHRINVRDGSRQQIEVGRFPVDVTVGVGAVWVSNLESGSVSRVDPASLRIENVQAGRSPLGLALGADALWVANRDSDTVTRIDLDNLSDRVEIEVGRNPDGVAVDESTGAVWVTNAADDTVHRIDHQTNLVDFELPVGDLPDGVAVGLGSVWVANAREGTISQIDPGA